MINFKKFTRAALCASSALHAVIVVGVGVAALAVSQPAMAQDYTNVTASGRVRGTDGKAVANAKVEVILNEQGFSRTTSTDASGGYRISQLPSGPYTIVVTATGYEELRDEAVSLTLDTAANQFTLVKVGSSEIVVTAGRVRVVDFDRTTTGAVIDVGDLAERVPVTRSISSIVQLSPGTTAGDGAFGDEPNIAGASVAARRASRLRGRDR